MVSNRRLTPCGKTRREFLWETGMGFTGTALTAMLAADGFFGRNAAAAENKETSPLAPRQPHFTAKAKSVIFLFMYGGVSQVDTWDPKPELTRLSGKPMPDLDKDSLFKVRNPGLLLGSTRKFSLAGENGIPVSDLYPHLAGCIDHLAVIRSMSSRSSRPGGLSRSSPHPRSCPSRYPRDAPRRSRSYRIRHAPVSSRPARRPAMCCSWRVRRWRTLCAAWARN